MSAIWGSVSFIADEFVPVINKMEPIYRKKCKIDQYSMLSGANYELACGNQFITKESHYEQLPFDDEADGFVLTGDIILDNRDEIASLVGVNNKSDDTMADGTLVCLAYKKWKENCFSYLRGLFAVAIYEKNSNRVILAVDQVSARCLYYYRGENGIVFSTLIDPILNAVPDKKKNDMYFQDFLMTPGLMPNLIAGETPYEAIHQVLPGNYLIFTKDKEQSIKYAKLLPLENQKCRSVKEYGSYFRGLYEECVSDALYTEGEVAVSMSSGLDSSSVGALAACELRKKNKNLYTYTYVPSISPEKARLKNNVLDETEDVKKIQALHPNMIGEFCDNEGKNSLDNLNEILDVMEMPVKAYVNLPNLFEIYRKAADRGCKIVLTGQCGNDTVSFGYIDDILFDLFERKKIFTFLSWLNRYSKVVGDSRKKALIGCWNYFSYAHKVLKRNRSFEGYSDYNVFASDYLKNNYPVNERFEKSGLLYLESIPTCSKTYAKVFERDAMYCYLGSMETKIGLYFGIVIRDVTKDQRMRRFFHHIPYETMGYRGIPRWYIRQNLRDILPKSLLDDWMRYGVQNVDCYSRIKRDWKRIDKHLIEELDEPIMQQWIDKEKIEQFLANWNNDKREEYIFDQSMFVYVLCNYLHLKSDC